MKKIFTILLVLYIFNNLYAACPAPGSGIVVVGGSATETGCTITTFAPNTPGLSATAGGTIDLSNSSVSTFGANSPGALIDGTGSVITLINTDVSTNAGGSEGFRISNGAVGNLDSESSIVTLGGSDAVTMTSLTASSIFNASNGSFIGAFGTASGLFTLNADPGFTNTVNISDSQMNSASSGFQIFTGEAEINITNSNLQVSTNAILAVGGSNVTVNTNNSTISGNVGSPVSTLNFFLNGSTWTGSAFDLTNLFISNSIWRITNNSNSNITTLLANNGTIEFLFINNFFSRLTVNGSYIGQNGNLRLNTFLGGDGSLSNQLVIDGGTATGVTQMFITNQGGSGALTTGDGILVVDAINGGTTDPGAFVLGERVVVGPYEYNLFRGGIDGSDPDDWFLRSQFRPEVPLYAALPSMALLYGRMLVDTLHQRVGDEDQLFCSECLSCRNTFNGYWLRAVTMGGYQNNNGDGENGPDFNYTLFAMQGGVDVYRNQNINGSLDHAGVLAAAGNGTGRVHQFDTTVGKNTFDVYSAGAYWTHFGCSGWYVDAIFEANWYTDVVANSNLGERLKTNGRGFITSVEAGYPFWFKDFILEPQVQLVHQSIVLNDSNDTFNDITFKDVDSFAGRIGARIAKTWWLDFLPSHELKQFTLWARTNFWHDFLGNSNTLFSLGNEQIGFPSDLEGNWFQGDVGMTLQLNDNLSIYASFGGFVYMDADGQAYNATGGLRANF